MRQTAAFARSETARDELQWPSAGASPGAGGHIAVSVAVGSEPGSGEPSAAVGACAAGPAIVLEWQRNDDGIGRAAAPQAGVAARRWLLVPALVSLACGGAALLYAAGLLLTDVAPNAAFAAPASDDVVVSLLPANAGTAPPAAQELLTIEPDVPAAAIMPTTHRLVSPEITGSIAPPARIPVGQLTVQSGLGETSTGERGASTEVVPPANSPHVARRVLATHARPRAAITTRNSKWTGTFFDK